MGWYNLLDLRTRVRDFLKERDDDGYWTNDELNRHINAGVREFGRKSRCVEACFSQDVQPGKQAYSAPGTMLQGSLAYVQFQEPGQDPVRLEYLDDRRFHFEYPLYTLGIPRVYTIWRDCIYLGPTPKRYDEAAIRLISEGLYTYALLPNGDRIYLLQNSTTLLGQDVATVEVVTAASLSLTGSNKVVVHLPEDEDVVLFETTSRTGTVTIVLDNYILKAKLPDGNYVNLYEVGLQSYHGTLHLHAYEVPEPFSEDTDGCEIHDEYQEGPVYYAVWLALLADSKGDLAAPFKAMFDSMVNEANWANRMHQFDQINGRQTAREELGRVPSHRRVF